MLFNCALQEPHVFQYQRYLETRPSLPKPSDATYIQSNAHPSTTPAPPAQDRSNATTTIIPAHGSIPPSQAAHHGPTLTFFASDPSTTASPCGAAPPATLLTSANTGLLTPAGATLGGR